MNEVCLVSDGFGTQFPVQAPSLRSLFFKRKILNISTQDWLVGVKIPTNNLNFTNDCFQSGFNVGNSSLVRARLGIVSVIRPGSGK